MNIISVFILTTKCFGKAKASSYQHILAEVIWESPKPLRIEYSGLAGH